MQALKNYSLKVISSGFLPVFFANIFSYFVAFCGSVFYARLLGTYEFGIYSFAYNIISFFLLVNGFGAASGVLQFVSRAKDSATQLSYLKYSITLGISFNCLLSIIIFIYAMCTNLPLPGMRHILIAMAFFPIGRLYIDVFQSYLRASGQNQLFAKFAISSNSIILILNVLGIYVAGLVGLVFATYLSYVSVILMATMVYKLPNIFRIKRLALDKKEFVSYSVYATVGNAFAQILFILDILILGYIIKDARVVAIYKIATIIPFALNFIPGIISIFFYPDFAKNTHDLVYVKQLHQKIQRGMLVFSILVSLVLIIIAKPLIIFIFGPEYIKSVPPFQILTFGFWIVATFRTINGNILASLGKARVAMKINLFIVFINISLTYILVTYYGIIGAAIGVVAIYILASIIASYVLHKVLN